MRHYTEGEAMYIFIFSFAQAHEYGGETTKYNDS